MNEEDIFYISENLSQLTGIPTRVYLKKELLALFSTVSLIKDPFVFHLDKLEEDGANISYFSTKHFFYYCIQRYRDYKIVVGPFRYFPADKQTLNELSFALEIPKEDRQRFINAMSCITSMPLETVLKSLCSYNFVLNGEKLSLKDLIIAQSLEQTYKSQSLEEQIEPSVVSPERNATMKIEETIARFVSEGDEEGFDEWVKNAPAVKSGGLSNDYLRHQKNTFIVTIALVSRAAIRGGMNYNDALNLSDDYIKRCEACKSADEISSLNFVALKDYIQKVAKIKAVSSPLETKVASYVYSHISEATSLDDLCRHLAMTKSNLCLRFKKETGLSVFAFIQAKKIDEAMRLLSSTSKPISSIALYLGYSSQAHFTKAFKDITGLTPSQYRKRNI